MCPISCLLSASLIIIQWQYNPWLGRTFRRIRSCLNQETCGLGSQPWSPGRSHRVTRRENEHAQNNNQDRHGYLASPKSKTVIANEPPWINKQLKSLIHDRQTAFALGDEASFRRPRNRVNRLRKSSRTKYYESKVEHLRDCSPRR